MKEEYAIVLDYLSRGYSSSYSGEPIAQAIGTTRFTLLELVPRDGVFLKLRQRVYIGPEERKEVKFIKGRLDYTKLTNGARTELPTLIDKIVLENEYINFFDPSKENMVRGDSTKEPIFYQCKRRKEMVGETKEKAGVLYQRKPF